MDILVCPLCKGKLILKVAKEKGGEIAEGTLHCATDETTYLIADTIPNLLPPKRS